MPQPAHGGQQPAVAPTSWLSLQPVCGHRPAAIAWLASSPGRSRGTDSGNSSAFGRTVTASGHSNRFAMGRMLSADTFSYGLRSKCADLAELLRFGTFFRKIFNKTLFCRKNVCYTY